MAPRRRVSEPPEKVFKSSTPLQQVQFPERATSIKSYGRRRTTRVPKQETLTQMDFIKMHRLMDEEEEEPNLYKDEDEERENEPRKKRRKTVGDGPSRTPQYHTQTITQLDWSFHSAPDDEEDGAAIDILKVSKRKDGQEAKGEDNQTIENRSPPKAQLGNMGPPQTPRRAFPKEIPSSQSPATPQSVRSLSKRDTENTPIPFNLSSTRQPSPRRHPKLVIEDTFETTTEDSQQTRIPSSPAKKSSSAKSVRFALPQGAKEDIERTYPWRSRSRSLSPSESAIKRPPIRRLEIMDSDAESNDDEDEPSAEHGNSLEDSGPVKYADEHLGPDTCYGEIGKDTQVQVEQMLRSSSEPSSPPENEEEQADFPEEVSDESHTTSTQHIESTQQQPSMYEKSQAMESQRLSTQHVNVMAPRTPKSDIFISIYPQHVTNIVTRAKDHEFRGWLMPSTVSRIWIYETRPVGMLKYMAVIGPAKRPGEILDENGVGNADFNKNVDRSCYAYEILELYELADPLTLKELIANEWLKGAVQKYSWVRPAVLDQLMANLKPPLFTQGVKEEDALLSSSTDTQEADEQLLSTIQQFTQLAPLSQVTSMPPADAEDDSGEPEPQSSEEVIPSSQQETVPPAQNLPSPSQATTVDLSQTQTPRNSIFEVVWDSPIRPILSSQSINLPTPRHEHSQIEDPLASYTLASSQLLTKSQMFPESLLNESIPGPPPFSEDSDRE